jgi:adhesin/invasin
MVSAVPTVIPADGKSTAEITATVRDKNGNKVRDGTLVKFYSDKGKITENAVTKDGEAKATLVSESSTTQITAQVWATDGNNRVESNKVTVTFNPVAAAILELSAEPTEIYVSGVGLTPIESTITARVLDAAGNPVKNEKVYWQSNKGGLSNSVTTTDDNGVTTVKLISDSTTGEATVIAAVRDPAGNPIVSQSVKVKFNPGLPDSGNSRIYPDPAEIPGNGVSTSTITVELKDKNGNPVADGTKVEFIVNHGSIQPAQGYGTPPSVPTQTCEAMTVGGISKAVLKSEIVTADTDVDVKVNAPKGSSTFIGPCTVGFKKCEPKFISASIDKAYFNIKDPNDRRTATITVQVADQFGLPVPDGTVIDLKLEVDTSVSPGVPVEELGSVTTPIVTQNGVATATYTVGTAPGAAWIRISLHDFPDVKTALHVYVSGGVARILMGFNPARPYEPSIWADGYSSCQIVAICIDRFGNPVNNADIVWRTTAGIIAVVVDSQGRRVPAVDKTGQRTVSDFFTGGSRQVQGASIAELISERIVRGYAATVTAIVPGGEMGEISESVTVRFTGAPPYNVEWEFYPSRFYTTNGRVGIRVRITDQYGIPIPDGTRVDFRLTNPTAPGAGYIISTTQQQKTSSGYTHPWPHYNEDWSTAATVTGGQQGTQWWSRVEITVSTPFGSWTATSYPYQVGHN